MSLSFFFPLLGTTRSISASSCQNFQLYLLASRLYLHLFCASICKMCPQVIVCSLYAILAYYGFIGIALLLNSGGSPYFVLETQHPPNLSSTKDGIHQ